MSQHGRRPPARVGSLRFPEPTPEAGVADARAALPQAQAPALRLLMTLSEPKEAERHQPMLDEYVGSTLAPLHPRRR